MSKPAVRKTLRGFFDASQGRAQYRTIKKRIEEDAKIDGIHLCQLIAAMLIASIGLNTDSTEAVIGAMLICPLMGSVIAIAYSIATIDARLLRESIVGLAIQFAVCLATSTLYFIISPLSGTTSTLLSNANATIWDVILALVGGFAGALGISRRLEPGTLIAGVAVATALMPPLCATGYGVAARDWGFAFSALYEFLINVVFIAFGATMVFVWLHVPLVADLDGDGVVTEEERARASDYSVKQRRYLVIGLLLFLIPCGYYSYTTVQRALEENGTIFEVVDEYDTELTTRELKLICPSLVSYRIGSEDAYDMKEKKLEQHTIATVETKVELTPAAREEVEALIRLHVPELESVSFVLSEQIAGD